MVEGSINLSQSPVFDDMTDDERQHLIALLQVEEYPQGEVILREGNETRILWFLIRGQCEVAKLIKPAKEKRFAMLDPGAIFGEMSFIHPAPHSASIRTLSEVEVARLSYSDYERLLEASPAAAQKIAFRILNVLAGRLRRMDDWTGTLVDCPENESNQRRQEWHDFRTKLYTEWDF